LANKDLCVLYRKVCHCFRLKKDQNTLNGGSSHRSEKKSKHPRKTYNIAIEVFNSVDIF